MICCKNSTVTLVPGTLMGCLLTNLLNRRTYIVSKNTPTEQSGRNPAEQEYLEINGLLYDNYDFADPLVGSLLATMEPKPILERAQEFIDANFYQIFYPLPSDPEILQNNGWRSLQCPSAAGP